MTTTPEQGFNAGVEAAIKLHEQKRDEADRQVRHNLGDSNEAFFASVRRFHDDATDLLRSLIRPETAPAGDAAASQLVAAIGKRGYALTEPRGSGWRLIIGFSTLKDAQDAQMAVSKFPSVQGGE